MSDSDERNARLTLFFSSGASASLICAESRAADTLAQIADNKNITLNILVTGIKDPAYRTFIRGDSVTHAMVEVVDILGQPTEEFRQAIRPIGFS